METLQNPTSPCPVIIGGGPAGISAAITLAEYGIMGGMQLQVKSNLVRPGHRIALTGTGPLLLVAAKQLHEAGNRAGA